MTPLGADYFDRSALAVAPDLIGAWLVHETPEGVLAGRIVETEAYLQDDPAYHGWNLIDHATGLVRPEGRGHDLFAAPGRAYVYLIYARHWMINVVCEREGVGEAVLIRALEPVRGLEAMYRRRPHARRDADLASGPGKLTQALGIDGSFHRSDLTRPPLYFADAEPEVRYEIATSSRIGITRGVELPYRYFARNHPCVSPGLPSDLAVARRRQRGRGR